MLVSFKGFELEPRFDDTSWIELRIFESATENGSYTLIDTQAIDSSPDPSDPDPINFTTDLATLQPGAAWYKIQIRDTGGISKDYQPVFNPATVEILASLDDINAHLDEVVIEATANNTNLVQISVARVVRGYLARVFDAATLMGWNSPENTPPIVREVAAMLIASRVYFAKAQAQNYEISDQNFGQRKYDEAMGMLREIISGDLPIEGEVPGSAGELTLDDFFPIDDTDRAFTLDMPL